MWETTSYEMLNCCVCSLMLTVKRLNNGKILSFWKSRRRKFQPILILYTPENPFLFFPELASEEWPSIHPSLVVLGRFLNFVIQFPLDGGSACLPIHRTTQKKNKRKQISIARVWFKPTIPVLEKVKTVFALDRAATETGIPVFKLVCSLFDIFKAWRSMKIIMWWW